MPHSVPRSRLGEAIFGVDSDTVEGTLLSLVAGHALTLTVAEGQQIVRVVRDTGRVVQVGSWQRSDSRFRLAVELARGCAVVTYELELSIDDVERDVSEVQLAEGSHRVTARYTPTSGFQASASESRRVKVKASLPT